MTSEALEASSPESVVAPRRRRLRLAVLLSHAVLVQVLTFVLRPTASYRALELDVPTPLLGVLAASFAVVPLLVAVPSGSLIDRLGEKPVMLAGASVLLLSCLSFVLFGGGLTGLVVSTALLGTGHLLSVVGQQALVANTTSPGRFDAAFGRYTFAASLGQALGPTLIIAFGGRETIPDTDRIFVGALVLAGVLLALSCALTGARGRSRAEREQVHGVRSLLRLPGLLRALLTSCVVLAAVDITLVYLPALGTEQGLASGVVGGLLTVRAVASMASRLWLGRLSARMGRRRLMLVSIAASALGMAVVPIAMPLWLLVLVVTVLGLGLGVGQPLTMSWLAEAAPPGTRGRAMSLRLTGNRLGQVVIPSAVGLVATGAGPAGVLWVTAGALAAVGVAARRLHSGPPTALDDDHAATLPS